MQKIKGVGVAFLALFFVVGLFMTQQTFAKNEDVIKKGVSIDSVDLGKLTYEEAEEQVEEMAKEKADYKVSIKVNKDVAETKLRKLGYGWSNKNVVDDAIGAGKTGNIIKRYKDDRIIKNEGMNFELKMGVDKEALMKGLKKVCNKYNVEAENASLKMTDSGFEIVPEQEGCVVDYDKSVEELYKYLTEEWDRKSDVEFSATTKISKPEYTEESLNNIDLTAMGTFTTYFSLGDENRNLNMKNGVYKIDGHTLYPGEQFSCNEHLVPWTEDNGWHPAGTYVDGEVEDSLGGGICQVSSTLYNALLRAEIKVVTRFSHSMAVGYVDLAADAALAGDYKDLVFENNTDQPIYIEGSYSSGGSLTFTIYGHDTRKASHSVEFVSETVSSTPIKESISKDPSLPEGYSETVSNGHVGYVAKLWKITYEDGKEVSKELLHTSTYAMAPKKIVQGTKKADSEKPTEAETKAQPDEKETKKIEKKQEEPEKVEPKEEQPKQDKKQDKEASEE